MNKTVQTFYEGVFNQAVTAGYSEHSAAMIAKEAVVSRTTPINDYVSIAQTKDFVPAQSLVFEIKNIHINQSAEGGVIFDGALAHAEFDAQGRAFTNEALMELADQLNDVGGYVDEHEGRKTSPVRDKLQAVTEWIKARYEDGKVLITGKLKKGFEWVVNKFKFLSIEADFPKSQVLKTSNKQIFTGRGKARGFVFTNNPALTLNKILAVRPA